jgi:hypothetical protein
LGDLELAPKLGLGAPLMLTNWQDVRRMPVQLNLLG